MERLEEDLKKSLMMSAEDGINDCLECGIDSFIEDGILKDFPIVSTLVSGLKVAKNVHDRNLLRQTLIFIKELNNGDISKETLDKYKKDIENDDKRCHKELERILWHLNNFIDKEKSLMLSRLFKAYIGKKIKWDEFCEYSTIIDRIFIEDIKILKDIYNGIIVDDTGGNKFRIERLYSIGIIGLNPKAMFSFGEQELKENAVNINCIGKKFVEIVF